MKSNQILALIVFGIFIGLTAILDDVLNLTEPFFFWVWGMVTALSTIYIVQYEE